MEISEKPVIRLNIGCGNKLLEGFINIDLDGEPDVKSDVTELPFEDNYADSAIAIHVLEHIWRWKALATLKEWYRVLKPGGVLILELPDLHKCCRAILKGKEDRHGLWGLFGDPNYQSELMSHKWAYEPEELRSLVKKAGFKRSVVRNPQYHGRREYRDMRLECFK